MTSCLFLLGNGTADALLVAYLGGRLHLPPSTLGLLFAGLGLSNLLSAPFAGQFVDRLAPRTLVTGALLAVSTSFAVLFNLPSLPVAAVVFMTLGPAVVAYTVAVDTLLQRSPPDELLGRVLAGYRTANKTATLLGELGGVGLATAFGLIVTLDVAVVAVALSAASALLLPANSLTTVRADTEAPRGDTTPFSGHSLQKDDRSNAAAVPFARADSACPLLPVPAAIRGSAVKGGVAERSGPLRVEEWSRRQGTRLWRRSPSAARSFRCLSRSLSGAARLLVLVPEPGGGLLDGQRRRGQHLTGNGTWCASWWDHEDARVRLEAVWRAWEVLRLEPTTGIARWLRDVADPQMDRLRDRDRGPFRACSEGKHLGVERGDDVLDESARVAHRSGTVAGCAGGGAVRRSATACSRSSSCCAWRASCAVTASSVIGLRRWRRAG